MSISSHHQAAVELSGITEQPIDFNALLKPAHVPGAGGIVMFSGEVRDTHAGKQVDHLQYESYKALAEKMIREIVAEAIEKWDLHYAAALHRIGNVGVSESAVVVVTAHAHRSEAYEANRYIIDRIKHDVPIWKCEHFTDGSYEWGGECHCHQKSEIERG